MRSKELRLVHKNHATVKPDQASLLVEWKLTGKAELSCEILEIYKSLRKCWKSQVSFCHQSNSVSQKAWSLPSILQEFKKYPRKLTCLYNQPRGHFIRVLNEKNVCDGGNFCLLWLMILKSVWYTVGAERRFSCDTVGREGWLAILISLLWAETDWNIRIGKQFCPWFSLAWLPPKTAQVWFLILLKETALSFFFLPLETDTSARLFCHLSFAQPRKILSKFSKVFAI